MCASPLLLLGFDLYLRTKVTKPKFTTEGETTVNRGDEWAELVYFFTLLPKKSDPSNESKSTFIELPNESMEKKNRFFKEQPMMNGIG